MLDGRSQRTDGRADLGSLVHFHLDYQYDVAHAYNHDCSTEPNYGNESIHFSEFKEDGALTASDWTGYRVSAEPYRTGPICLRWSG